ncbi:porin [Parasalinivibrio latis]|uniref:porin n=1 Tax=Parasalinivibrio latis TaxID=2952610 RepID=UPI0030E5A2EC
MNKKILAAVLASLLAGTTHAATIYKNDNGDNIKVYGGAEVGGTFVSDTDKTPFGPDTTYVDDSFATIGLKGQTGNFFAKFEVDAERQDWTKDNNIRLVVDKMVVGFNFAKGQSIEFGRTDTAYDKVDGFGDMTNELGVGISEAGDQDNTIRYTGDFGKIKLSVSHSMEGWDGDTYKDTLTNDKGQIIGIKGEPVKYSYETDSLYGQVTNGYIGYYGDSFTVIAGAEHGDETDIYSLHSQLKLGKLTLGGLIFDETKNFNGGTDSSEFGANIGGKYAITDQMNLLASFNYSDIDTYTSKAYFGVFGAEYMYAKNIKLAAEVAVGDVLETKNANKEGVWDTGALGYLKAYYWF